MTGAFFGGVYSHSNSAHNVRVLLYSDEIGINGLQLLAMMRVGVAVAAAAEEISG